MMIAAETTKVKKMDDNCPGNWKEYSERADRGPGRVRKQGRNGSATGNEPLSWTCVGPRGCETHTRKSTNNIRETELDG